MFIFSFSKKFMVAPYLNLGRQVTSTIVGTTWLFTFRLVLITIGRMPALSHSLMPAITSALDSGAISLSTVSEDAASGEAAVVVAAGLLRLAQPASVMMQIVKITLYILIPKV
jgi:hypothetical protein